MSMNQAFTSDPVFFDIKQYFNFIDLENYSKDFGGLLSEKPLAVLMPTAVEMLQKFLRLANQYKVKVTCRGKGNSAYGQSLVKDGVVIDLKDLQISPEYTSGEFSAITVPAFMTWFEVTEYTKQKNKTVPVVVDNLDLTVGGTLSFGAIGGSSYRYGSAADNVLRLDVVTVDGSRHLCSKTENRDLFDAVLCGIGQCGIIISATLSVVTAKKYAKVHAFSYSDANKFLKDQKILCDLNLFDHVKGSLRKKEGAWEYVIKAVFYTDNTEKNGEESFSARLSTLSLSFNTHNLDTVLYYDFINMVKNFVKDLRQNGKLEMPHPWYNVFMPEDEIEEHLLKVLDSPYFTNTDVIIVYPVNSEHFQQPLFIKPKAKIFYVLAALYNFSFDASADFPYGEVLAQNQALYVEAREKGGFRYPVDAQLVDDWARHYGDEWNNFSAAKHKFDPNRLLSTGVNIF
jgi:cytokinin dehydrogenase